MIRILMGFAALLMSSFAAEADDLFAYDSSAPIAPVYGKPGTIAPGVTSRSISFASPSGHMINGEIIGGAAKEKHPGILFVHWLGDPKTTNHTEFEADAIALAKRGATSLLIDAMWSAPNWFDHMGVDAKADLAESTAQVIDLRRSLDVLEAQPNIDAARITYVGHDFGAMFGALMAGVEQRPRFYVLMAGTATMDEWYLLEHKAKDEAAYRAIVAPLDIAGGLKQSKANAFLFQFSAHDHYIAPDRANLFFQSAPLPKGAFWYDAAHDLAVPAAFADRQAWLVEHLFAK
jgi:dienelactone hydrolase